MTTQGCHCERSEAISFSHLAEAEMGSSIRALALLIAAAAVCPGIAVAADASLSARGVGDGAADHPGLEKMEPLRWQHPGRGRQMARHPVQRIAHRGRRGDRL